MGRVSKVVTQQQYQALLTGLPKYCPTTTFVIGGTSYTTAQVVTLVTSILDVASAVAPAKAAAKAAVAAAEAKVAADGQIVKGVREIVALMFNNAPQTLASLDIQPRKSPQPLSAEARVAAAAKAEATRKARGTTGKKQKAAITGNVTGVTITPITGSTVAAAAAGTSVPSAGAAATTSVVAASGTAVGASVPLASNGTSHS
jgi:hypothetical protein